MRGLPNIVTFRDADILGLLIHGGLERSFGLVGSDTLVEQAPAINGRLAAERLMAIDGLRFALAARPDNVQRVISKLNDNEPLRIGTSYPRLVGKVAERHKLPLQVKAVAGGQVERLANLFPRHLDGVVDIVQTGKSLREQNLRIVIDNLFGISLCAVWPANSGEPATKSATYGV